MIRLFSGVEFQFVAASGSLGFDGDDAGHGIIKLWKKWYRWTGQLDPSKFVIITKTLTMSPRRGNLRWYAPWRAARIVGKDEVVNAVALTNPGIVEWRRHYYPRIKRNGYKVIVSIYPENEIEAIHMSRYLPTDLAGIEINAHCPNTENSINKTIGIFNTMRNHTDLPIIIKFGYYDPWEAICKELDGAQVAAFDLINAIPWYLFYPKKSPLDKYGYPGAVSGKSITQMSLGALTRAKEIGLKTPIISGGGVINEDDVKERIALGADAVAFGTMFLFNPGLPNKIVRNYVGTKKTIL